MKSTTSILLLMIILILSSCTDSIKTKNQDKKTGIDSLLNCYELIGTFPNLTLTNKEYYGKIFLAISFDSTKKTFEGYIIARSALWNKSDKSIFSEYNSDTKIPIPEIYNQIIQEIKGRINSSGLRLERKQNIRKCIDINWVILPVVLK